MKSNEIFSFLFNPFVRIAGWQAFGIGLLFVLAMGTVGAFSNVAFDGVVDMHLVQNLTFARSFAYLGISLSTLILVMYIAGFIVSKDFRFIDVAGTIILSKAPFLLLAIVGFFAEAPDLAHLLANTLSASQKVSLIVVAILSIPVSLWSIFLMYNAVKVSIGAKGPKLTAAFIIAIVVSEIISKLFISILP